MPRPDYTKEHYCVNCNRVYPKSEIYCTGKDGCGKKLRFTPYRIKKKDRKELFMKMRSNR